MIAAWMLTVSVIGALLLLAALAGDAACARLGWPRRWLWATTMVAMCVLPLVPHSVPLLPDAAFVSHGRQPIAPAQHAITPLLRPTGAPTGAPPIADVPTRGSTVDARPVATSTPLERSPMRTASTAPRGPRFFVTDSSPLVRADAPLVVLWAGLSVTVVLLIATAMHRLRRERATWVPADGATRRAVRVIAGDAVPVWRSTHLGPAAFGVGAMHVVLPRWIDELGAAERALLIAHESEHVRGRDPRLLAAALALVAALPWHLPLVFAYRRLCRAVEHDCDARVLAVHADVRSYGRLLVRTAEWLLEGQRTWRGPGVARWILAPVPAFAAPASELEARLRALGRRRRSWHTHLGALLGGIGALVAITMACAVPVPMRASVTLTGPEPIAAAVADPVANATTIAAHAVTEGDEATAGSSPVPSWFGTVVAKLGRDSIVSDAAFDRALETGLRTNLRRRFPELLDPRRPGDAHVRLVLGPTGDAIAHGVDAERPDDATGIAAPGRAHRGSQAAAWRARFPMLASEPDAVGMHDLRVGERTVHVLWALSELPQRPATDGSRSGDLSPRDNVLGYAPPRTRLAFQQVMADDRLLDVHLETAIADIHPEVVARDRRDTRFAWVVLDSVGRAIAIDTGRAGMGREVTGLRALWPVLPRATDDTPIDDLVIDRTGFALRFPTVRVGDRVAWRGAGSRTPGLNILWALGRRR